MAPDSRGEPVVLPFSMSATGTSPSCSVSFSSSASSCIRRIAHARPAGPPPPITPPPPTPDQAAGLDPLVLGIGRRADVILGGVDGRRVVDRCYAHGLASLLGLH